MRNEGLGSWPARRARKSPHRPALVHGDTTVSYAALHTRTTRLAHALRAAGLRQGDRVAYLGPNHPSFLEALFAAGQLGAIFVPLNTRLAAPELAYQLRDAGARILIYAPAFSPLAAELRHANTVPASIEIGPHYERLIEGAAAEPLDEPVRMDEPCVILYTSGTTGRPKGVVLSHANLTWNAINVLIDNDLTAHEAALVCAPLFHAAGLGMLTLPVLLKGGMCVLTESFDPNRALDLVERHRISFMFAVPTMYEQLARSPRWPHAELTSLRLLMCGGAPVPTALTDLYLARGLTFQQGYGLTEAAPGTLLLDADHAVSKAGTAGVPHFFSDVRVVRPDRSRVAVGETGELQVSGPHVMRGYWGLPAESDAAVSEGWLHTGDAARIDEDGYLTIADRIKDMIISGGENIYPAEVEDVLLRHPDIAECAVIGIPDPTWGETPRALVVPRPGAKLDPGQVTAHLTGRLAKYKTPKSVVVVPDLPRTASGKLLKHRLRELYGAPDTPPTQHETS
jgi:fatty-acyl-CoA synthase